MGAINILLPHVADLIAAGEVVERPGSVVKELLENAIDAGAKNISVEIRGGGMTFLRVRDDGVGMNPEDAGIAFLRHATSKLSCPENLEAISTLGFRGEALAAISAVSKIELLTRTKNAQTGTRVVVEAGEIIDMDSAGCPIGTCITVRDIFYNTPARLKFLKSNRAEGIFCRDISLKCALGRPDIALRCIRDNTEEFSSTGDGLVSSAVYSLLGREISSCMLPCFSESDGIKVSGVVSSPKHCRGNRSSQFFFCNGRFIKSTLIQAAFEQAYQNTIMTGRFPAGVIYLELDFASVDVNVHPSKIEVKFSNERKIFDSVYYCVLSALSQEDSISSHTFADMVKDSKNVDGKSKKDLTPYTPIVKKEQSNLVSFSAPPIITYSSSQVKAPSAQSFKTSPAIPPAISNNAVIKDYTDEVTYQAASELDLQKTICSPEKDKPDSLGNAHPTSLENNCLFENDNIKIIGEAMATYIIVEQDDLLVFIDKHAAHERIIFDKLKQKKHDIMSQVLLSPVTLTPGVEITTLISENISVLSDMGFELEPFGKESVVLRSIPSDTDICQAQAMVEEIVQKITEHQGLDFQDQLLHMIACKGAIKAGKTSTKEELMILARKVLSGEIKYCPHGRPVSFVMTKGRLDKEFCRIL